MSPTYRIVVKGMVHNILGDKLHHKPLPDGYLKVSIDVALDQDAELLIPDDVADIRLVRDAIGTYVAWQRNLISLNLEISATYKGNGNDGIRRGDESVTSKKQIQTQKLHEGTKIIKDKPRNMSHAQKLKEVNNKGRHSNIPITKQRQDIAKTKHQKPNSTKCRPSWVLALKSLVEVQMENSDTRQITMEEGIFGEEQYNEEITKEQMYEFFNNTEIGVSVVCVYIRYLYEKFVRDTDVPRKFSFLSPHRISLVLIEAEQEFVKAYMVKEFLKYKDEHKLFILPFYIHKPIVLKVFRAARNAQVSKNKFNNIQWVRVQCPRQENGIDCGYFVMRFMKEILISKLNEIPKLYIEDFKCATYSNDKLREIQEEWCQFMMSLLFI
ncbi:uncharacterized protein [Medicago truncatula]|uniref:uncharacterized protein isoform X2 n=1 Tax=Medicago truncatula TaxID=3880 RepID=UPI001967F500|nr:uncharacterized protein LOC120576934 isoform X2 [Medicago truncatula]